MWYGQGYSVFPFGMIFGMLFFLVIIGILIYLIFGLNRDRGPHATQPQAPEAKSILDRRFAQGDITREQYEEAIGVLGYHSPRK
ncbi:MAG: hypothetical protein M0Z34_11665 [Nitrospiraceae bacterium]|nr:hypothetical protein [Nitrospiraceae bacterium]